MSTQTIPWETIADWYKEHEQVVRDVMKFEGLRGAVNEVIRLAPVPNGYKLVPLTPTAAMVEAGINTLCGDDEHQDYRDVYAAMIGAAP